MRFSAAASSIPAAVVAFWMSGFDPKEAQTIRGIAVRHRLRR
jgi:hypothetical protein